MQSRTIIAVVLAIFSKEVASLDFNAFRSPQIMPGTFCSSRGPNCVVQLDVPEPCVNSDLTSDCPIIFFLHDERMTQENFKLTSGVHQELAIGVYPRSDCTAWNTKQTSCNLCSVDDYSCIEDPDDPQFIADIIIVLRQLGAFGNIYIIGSSNGGSLAQKLAVNAGKDLPIKGIVSKAMPLLSAPPRSGPGKLNYNQPVQGNPEVSILSIHGTNDFLIPYYGGDSEYFEGNTEFQFMSATESVLTWASHNGCDLVPAVSTFPSSQGSLAYLYEYENCKKDARVMHYEIVNGGRFPGRNRIDGVRFDDIAFDFIRSVDGFVGKEVFVGTLPPTISPDPSPALVCKDDPEWLFWNSTFDCDFVSENPRTRCVLIGLDGRPARVACPLTCDDRCYNPFSSVKETVLFLSRLLISWFIDKLDNLLGNFKDLDLFKV